MYVFLHATCPMELPQDGPRDGEEAAARERTASPLQRWPLYVTTSWGRHFLHGHAEGATSWSDPWMISLLRHPQVRTAVSDQCEYGLVTHNGNGDLIAAKKPTRWATTSEEMRARRSTRCSKTHPHKPLLGGRAAAAALFSPTTDHRDHPWHTGYSRR